MTSNSFFKTDKSTVMSSTDQNIGSHMATANNFFRKTNLMMKQAERDSHESPHSSMRGSTSDLISNADHVVTGGTLSILRRKNSYKRSFVGPANHPVIGKELHGDI